MVGDGFPWVGLAEFGYGWRWWAETGKMHGLELDMLILLLLWLYALAATCLAAGLPSHGGWLLCRHLYEDSDDVQRRQCGEQNDSSRTGTRNESTNDAP